MSALRELLAVFDIRVDDEELKKGADKVQGFIGTLRTVAPALAEAFALRAVGEFVTGTIEAGARVVDLSNRLGIGTNDLQQFQFAARTAGVESESAAHSLGFLNRSVGEALTGSAEAAQAFAKLHVNIRGANGQARSTGAILDDVAEGMSKLPDQQTRAAYAMKLFGREGQQLLPVLSGGKEGLEALRTEFDELGGGMSEKFVQDAKKADDAFAGLKVGVVSLRSRIVGEMLPAIEALTNKAKAWIKIGADWLDNTTLLDHGLRILAGISAYKLITTLVKMGKAFGLLKPSILETALALWEWAAPILLIGGLVLVLEDLWTALEGGDSIIGQMMDPEQLKELQDGFTQIKAVWDDVEKTLGDVSWATVITDAIEGIVGAFGELLGLGRIAFHLFEGLGKTLGDAASGVVGALTGNTGLQQSARDSAGKDQDQAIADIGKDLGGMAHILGFGDHPAVQTVPTQYGPQDNSGPTLSQYGAPPAGSVAGNVTHQKNEINVVVQGGKNPKETGQVVGDEASKAIDNWNASYALDSL